MESVNHCNNKANIRYVLSFLVLMVLLGVLFVWNVNSGSVDFTIKEILAILIQRTGDETSFHIVWDIRLPRIMAAIILGGALSVAGFLLQTFFGNPIAGPYVLGISSGAKLMVSIVMVVLLGKGMLVNSFFMILAAFAGAMLSMGFVLAVSKKVQKMSVLVICGVMIGYICSAITEFIVTFAEDSNIVNLHNWSMGSFSGMSWDKIQVMALVVMMVMFITFCLSKPISAYQMGEAYAKNLGVNVRILRVLLILMSSILAASVTAFAGPVSFVGIAVPHLVKSLLKTAKPLFVIPACFLGGATFCLFCDLIARTVFAPTELSISSVTAVFGAPVVIYVMIRKQSRG